MSAYYNEFDPGAAAWLRELIKKGMIADGEVDERSILDVRPVDLRGFDQCHFFAGIGGWSYALRLAGWPDDRQVWTGSPPCQPFSSAGARGGRDDERHLAPHFVDLVRACRPGLLFGEQVASAAVFGKAASGSRKAAQGATAPEWAWLDDLSDRLEAARYAVGATDIPAAGVGAPHIRQRTFFCAVDLDRMAHGSVTRLEGYGGYGDRGHEPGRVEADPAGPVAEGGRASGLADGHGDGCDQVPERAQRSGERDLEPRGGVLGVADASVGRWREERADPGRGSEGDCEEGRGARYDASSRLVGVADPDGTTGREVPRGAPGDEAPHGAARRDRSEPDSDHRRAGHGEDDSVAHAAILGWQRGWASETGDEPGAQQRSDGFRDAGGLDADGTGFTPDDLRDLDPRPANGPADLDPVRPGQGNGGWADADWLFCRDGKWRPVEPGTFPLAHGVSARVGRLRGYGNAIVPQAAAEFIGAASEILIDRKSARP